MSTKLLVVFSVLAVVAHAAQPRLGNPSMTIRPSVNRIVGGNDAKKGEFPHQALLEYKYPDSSFLVYACGGVILNSQWILTAGHCVPKLEYSSFVVKVGKHFRNIPESTEQTVDVASFYVHEKYVGGVAPYDIALLKLKTPLKLNEYVNVISLPKAGSKPDGVATFSGWGSNGTIILPAILQKAELPIVDLATCKSAIQTIAGYSPVHETNVCAGPMTGGISVCGGDSGGPLILKNSAGVYEVVGLSSWVVFPCGTEGAPSVHTGVANFIDWIHSTMKKHE